MLNGESVALYFPFNLFCILATQGPKQIILAFTVCCHVLNNELCVTVDTFCIEVCWMDRFLYQTYRQCVDMLLEGKKREAQTMYIYTFV